MIFIFERNTCEQKELVDALAKKASITKKDRSFLDAFVDVVSETLSKGKS